MHIAEERERVGLPVVRTNGSAERAEHRTAHVGLPSENWLNGYIWGQK